jgi:Tetratricopeptide repeat
MKSEHRHELQTNDLEKFATNAARYIDQHGNRLTWFISVGAIVLAVGIYWYRTQSNKSYNAQAELSIALMSRKPEVMDDIWNRYPKTVPALWAKLYEGEWRLDDGVSSSFRNLEKALEDIKKAQEAFQLVVDEKGVPAEIRERALIGLARAQESGSDGNEEAAVKTYEQFVKEFPKSLHKADAESRIKVLKSEEGREFYAWFSKYTRPKIEEKRPHDTGSSDGEDLTIPDPSESKEKTTPAGEKPDFIEPGDGATKPAEEAAKPEDEADAKPADSPEAAPTEKPEATPEASSPETEAKPEN